MRTREIPFFVSFIYFFFNLACCSCLCCCGYRRLRVILVNLNCYFTLKALQKRFTVTPLPSHAPSPILSLSILPSPVVWFLCHFYAHYFAFAACPSLALCLLSIYNHNNNSKNKSFVVLLLLLLLYFVSLFWFLFVCCCCRRRSRFHCLQSPCRIFITLCIMMSSNAADNLWST